ADLQSNDEGFDIDLNSTIKSAAFGPPKTPRYSDPYVQFRAKGNFAGKKGLLRFEKMTLTGQFGSVEAKAKIAKFDDTMDLDVAGTFTYDLATFEPLLKTYLGANARIEGNGHREIRCVGALRAKGGGLAAAIEMPMLQAN